MPEKKRIVYIVDDDASVLRGLKRLMDASGYDAHAFASADELLAAGLPGDNSCLLIDLSMPGMDGLRLREELVRQACRAPVIFITSLNSPDIRQRAKCAGGVGFFQKPVDAEALLDAINWALTTGAKEVLS